LGSLIFHSFYQVSDHDKTEQQLLAKANLLSLQFPQEKIYLHLDRPSYFVGEDIWFKAYLQNQAIPNCNIYIELIDASGDVIDKKINWAQNGLAYGDFHLDNSLESGVYQIRAYTNWMRNFDDAWFFRKDLIIWNRRDGKINPELAEIKPKDFDLQFLPEGGTFVPNTLNKVAFKAIDKNGKGISVSGEIVDDLGNKQVDFKSGFKGMGSIVFEPLAGRKYKAKAVVADKFSLEVDLPVPQADAIKLSVEPNIPDKIRLQIYQEKFQLGSDTENKLLLIGQSNGQICYRREIIVNQQTNIFEIDKNVFPTGIVKLTLFDNDLIPRCERLFFADHHDHVNVEIVPDKQNYLTREKVQFDIKTIANNETPFLSNLSLSVYNSESSIETEEYPNNILTHFLLTSELKGTIEDAAWYFKDDSISTLSALDNLMLTHGYRYFDWEEIVENNMPEIKFQPEESVQIKGRILHWLTNRPIAGCNVTMMSVNSLLAVHQETTDSLGNFVFSDLFVNDTVDVSLQAGNTKQRKNYWIELDNRSSISPLSKNLPVNYRYSSENKFTTNWYLSEINSDLKDRKWHLSDTILLGDVNIVSTKIKKQEGVFRPYLDADYILEVSKQDDIYEDVFEMMENTSAYMRNYMLQNPTYYLDGMPAEVDFINGLPTSWFDKIEAVHMAPARGGFRPALYFYTNRGKTRKKDLDGIGVKAAKILGYSVIRKFYSPVYETRDPANTENDFRNTIYWNPIVRTDSTGVAQVSFFNSDETGNIKVVVEGVTADGKLCRGVGSYFVKP
jgi:hypothetical protein